ncbi:MAM domain-containing glycosylphosphatidylinositol anchor protein 1 [Papilio machaon]|uniref:MAM domain-containing glycosylphosphatidylinositol anchor protein 1 n=1 Tax=Papilio machaon TaxID=76193 RepID=A0A0N1PIK3_PAPMA|nr:MAM domain-containing glycosylphosphatidylinositol anchor protein 1 [Papilio machaon]
MYPSSASCGFPRLANGRVRVRQKSRLVKFICSPRYELVGNKYATCRGSQWDVPLPVCVRSGCTVPSIENGVEIPSRQNAWVVFFCLPGHKMIGSSTIYCDGRKWNGTAPSCIDATSSGLPKCDFEDPNICGWMQDDLHDFDWTRLNHKSPSYFLFTGPSYDHTYGKGGSGYYMYIESTSRLQNDTARLISPIYDGGLAKDGCFVFFYHMYGKTTGGLRVYQKPENYALSSLLSLNSSEKQKYILFEKWGNQGNTWYDAVLPLVDFSDNFQVWKNN